MNTIVFIKSFSQYIKTITEIIQKHAHKKLYDSFNIKINQPSQFQISILRIRFLDMLTATKQYKISPRQQDRIVLCNISTPE